MIAPALPLTNSIANVIHAQTLLCCLQPSYAKSTTADHTTHTATHRKVIVILILEDDWPITSVVSVMLLKIGVITHPCISNEFS